MSFSTIKLMFAQIIMITLWGSAFAGIRIGLAGFSPEHLSLMRLLVGSVTLLVYGLWKRMKLPEFKDIPMIVLLGFLGFAVYQTTLNIGERTVHAGAASLIVSLTPIFSGLFSFFLLRKKQGKQMWIGSIVGFFGVAFISVGTGGKISLESGAVWILLSSLSESVYFIIQERYIHKYGFVSLTAYTIWGATLCMLIFTPGLKEDILQASFSSIISTVYLGVFPTVMAYLALAYITAKTGASEATISLYLTPVAAFIIAWIWLGEMPSLPTVFGGLITLTGVMIANLTLTRKKDTLKKGRSKAAS
jgi:drug/metabolite transporter (DMT)-like permease